MKSISFIFAPRLFIPTRSIGDERGVAADVDEIEVLSFWMVAANIVLCGASLENGKANA